MLLKAMEESELVYAINQTAVELSLDSNMVRSRFLHLLKTKRVEVYKYGSEKDKYIDLSFHEVLRAYDEKNFSVFVCLSGEELKKQRI